MKTRSAGLASLLGRLRRGEDRRFEVMMSEEAWRKQLTPAQFRVLRRRGTEAPFTGQAVEADAEGVYRCAACDGALFSADAKFDSGTGWPSFSDSVPDGVELRRDYKLGVPRTEVLCRRCGGHLGHVFNDGPGPGRKRYCINGCALAPGERPVP
jgi:peptide-methionine (R)-S-oxide reductase